MKINQKFECFSGSFETDTGELVCVRNDKYAEVKLCMKENMNIPFAKIKLFSRDLYVDAEATMDDAYNLGNEICKRWNLNLVIIDKIKGLETELDEVREDTEFSFNDSEGWSNKITGIMAQIGVLDELVNEKKS